MCKKDTEGGSYCCCKCCTPTVSSIVVAIVGAAILVASFVIAAVVLTMLQDGIAKTARYNSPRSDAKAFNDWLSNVPSKRSTNDASLKYYQYYFFNITNLNAVVTNSLTAAPTSSVLPIVDEIGPYTYRYFVDRLDPTFDADDERLSYKEYYRYIFDPTLSKMGSRQLDDQTDVFTTTSAAYSVIFGNPFNPTGLFGASEFQFRIGTSTQLPIPYMAWLDNTGPTSFDGALFNISAYLSAPMCSGVGVADCANRVYSLHTMHSSQILAARQAQGYTSARATFVKYGAAIFGTANKWATSPPLEYWDFADTIANNASYKLPATPLGSAQALWLYQPGLTATGVPSCPSLALGVSGTAGCWLAFSSAQITAMLSGTIGLTETQVIGIQNYLGYLTFNYWDWLFGVNGHQGASFAATFRTTFPECPIALTSTLSSNYNGGTTAQNCTAYNNGNMYVKATPRSLLFEQYNLLGPFLFGSSTRTFNRRGNISFSTNYSSELDARQDSFTYTVGTGINHINDIDNLYLWKNRTRIPTNITGTWCHKAEDPTYAPGGVYPMQHFTLVPGWTYRQANQAQMTKYTPSFPPGKVSDTNRYSFEKSVLSDKSFAVDLFVGDISRHAKMVFYRDDSVKGIDIQRYTIDDSEFNAGLLFFGQYFKGLANYSCPAAGGVNTFSCYPRYGKLEQSVLAQANYLTGVAGSVLATTGIDLVTIQAPNNDDFLANSQMGPLFGDANELIAMIDLEPISGAALGGTLKQQVNILVQPYIGAYLPNYLKTIQGGYPGKAFRSAAPNSHQARATLMPVYWLNKIGYLSDKQADSFKSLVYGAQLASRVVLIVGSIVGGLMMFVALGFLIVKRRGGYNTQTSKSDLAL